MLDRRSNRVSPSDDVLGPVIQALGRIGPAAEGSDSGAHSAIQLQERKLQCVNQAIAAIAKSIREVNIPRGAFVQLLGSSDWDLRLAAVERIGKMAGVFTSAEDQSIDGDAGSNATSEFGRGPGI